MKLENPSLRVLCLGAGVQSSTLAMMATVGELEHKPDIAIFADTGWETDTVYKWLEWLENNVSFPIRRVTLDSIGIKSDVGILSMPLHVINQQNSTGILRRQCTANYKLVPIKREIRKMLGMKITGRPNKLIQVEQWIGISTDEIFRMKEPREKWLHGRWPLIEINMSREDCKKWMKNHGYPEPPRSACIGCPYKSNKEWKKLIQQNPEAFKEALSIDEYIRSGKFGSKLPTNVFLHYSAKPLAEIISGYDVNDDEDFFNNECEGLCGV